MIAGDAVGRLAVAEEPSAGITFVLNAAFGAFTLTGVAAFFGVTFQMAQGAFALSGQSATLTAIMPASFGQFLLNGTAANIEISKPTLPMATRRDFWDVDEWGKFIPGSGLRYTI